MFFSRPGSSTTKSSWVLKTALSTSTNSARPTSFHPRVPARHRRNELQGARQSRTDEPEIVEPVGPRSHPTAAGDEKICAYYPRHRDELHRLISGVERSERR